WLVGLCDGRTRRTWYRQPAGQKFLLQRRVLALQAGDLGLQRRAFVGHHLHAQPTSLRLHWEIWPVRVSSRSTPSATGYKLYRPFSVSGVAVCANATAKSASNSVRTRASRRMTWRSIGRLRRLSSPSVRAPALLASHP